MENKFPLTSNEKNTTTPKECLQYWNKKGKQNLVQGNFDDSFMKLNLENFNLQQQE